ncbi:MAG: Epimerase family protein [Chloroflexi bacterium]|nr:Epimerase family protein [Chloroflexota bacterium]
MNVLISGGTGLIGRALSAKLSAEGHRVIVLTRSPEKARNVLPSGVNPVRWDGESLNGWSHLMEEMDAVVNLAGESIAGESLSAILTQPWTERRKSRILNSRVNVGRVLVAAIQLAEKKPSVFVQASAVGYYGPHGEEVVLESTGPGSDFLAKVCQAWEDSTVDVERMGVRRVILRTGLVLSGQGGILPVMLLPFRFFVGGPLGGGEQVIPWIHIQDHVDAIRFLLENEKARGVYNLSAPNPVTNAEFGRVAGKVLHRPYWLPVPELALRLALGEKASLILDGQRALPWHLQTDGYTFTYQELGPALEDLVLEY